MAKFNNGCDSEISCKARKNGEEVEIKKILMPIMMQIKRNKMWRGI
jgi:hypothetical protein